MGEYKCIETPDSSGSTQRESQTQFLEGEGSASGPPLDLQSFLPAMLRRLDETMAETLSRRYRGELMLTATELRIILLIGNNGHLNSAQIVVSTGIEKSKVSRAVKQLQSAEFVVIQRSAEDRRKKVLALTPRGGRLYETVAPRLLEWEQELLSCLTTREYRNLIALLLKLQAAVDQL